MVFVGTYFFAPHGLCEKDSFASFTPKVWFLQYCNESMIKVCKCIRFSRLKALIRRLAEVVNSNLVIGYTTSVI